ncbi:phosphatase PAP2 family protein [Anabaena cylindrica FACHB-243]|uniref:Phosphoesterase PA-phosphatase related protein n=1 Tax=Anabaena cylindrica (strain ATCC 27899 / PCC 7122) TaxID=272123 RepID=K9ZEK3_ANACC|nr:MULTISPECIES: phosphatase PAP2 family protein [Anabaena]AFZ56780.1 phosphoesterase PA-phosphatase related protein [Anabaena cylindrica PCC 7122]MBD2418574.1 phosphatase PAP2 family protein [Anabaena cylindrica FACHB-243]MBY5283586.1 phosphatase PAP2 family protein [Anabaena sp. CCAP 1446/1C]MBY5309945.1 phosphatase PAP2 family protein [Anabaena sp. CCAP 1446/1C]MCM2409320.1 phosphatase PAP2 family protein [Anabaena sp. CCAP 1446/1C]
MFKDRRKSPLNFLKNLLLSHWRSLLLMLMGVYLPLQVVEILAVKIWQSEDGFPWDAPILWAIHSTANPQLDIFAVVLTKWGSFWTALPVLSAIAILLLRDRRWRTFAYLLTTALGTLLINRTAKEFMHRVRPQLWISKAPEFDYAFPSGHAMTSMTLVAILVILTWHRPWRWLVLTIGSLYLLAIAWTRLYLGVHFPSDILAGWMVALAWAIGVSLIIKPNLYRVTATNSNIKTETTLLPEEKQLTNSKLK